MRVDVERFLGTSSAECNCWELLRQVYLDNGIELPSYAGHRASPEELREAEQLVYREASGPNWQEVHAPAPGDAVLCWYLHKAPTHVGVMTSPGQMLHMQLGGVAALADLNSPFWERRIVGYYRWQG